MAHRPSPSLILEPGFRGGRKSSDSDQSEDEEFCYAHGDNSWVPSLRSVEEAMPLSDGKRFRTLVDELVSEYEAVRLGHSRAWSKSKGDTFANKDVVMTAIDSFSQKTRPSQSKPIEHWAILAQRMMRMQAASNDAYELRDCWQLRGYQGSTIGLVLQEPSAGVGADLVHSVWRQHNLSWVRKSAGRSVFNGEKWGAQWVGPVIHPDSFSYLIWVLCGLLFIVLDVFFFSMSVFGLERSFEIQILDCIYWSLDVMMNFRLGFHSHDRVVMEPRAIAKSYLRHWFSFDFALMIMGWLLSFLVDGYSGTGMLRYFRFVRLTRLLRVSKFSTSVHELAIRIQTDIGTLALRTVSYMFVVAIWIHFNACLFFWIGDHEEGWSYHLDERQISLKYIIAVHWAASQFQGGIDIYPSFTLAERVVAVLSLLGSVAIAALVISKITTLLGAIQAAKKARNLAFHTAHRFATQKGVRAEVLLEVYRYLNKRKRYQVRQDEIEAEKDLFARLPFNLRRRLLEEARWPQLRNRTIFLALSHCSKHFITQLLCDVLQNVMHLPDQQVFQYGVLCPRVYIVVSGDGYYTRYAKTFAAILAGESVLHTGLGVGGDGRKIAEDQISQGISQAEITEAESLFSETMPKDFSPDHSNKDKPDRLEATPTRRAPRPANKSKPQHKIDIERASSISSRTEFHVFEDRHKQLQGSPVVSSEMLCEAALWTAWLHVGDFEAVGELGLFTINVSSFSDLVVAFPSVQKNFRLHAQRVVRYLRSGEDCSDLLTSEQMMSDSSGTSVSERDD